LANKISRETVTYGAAQPKQRSEFAGGRMKSPERVPEQKAVQNPENTWPGQISLRFPGEEAAAIALDRA